MVFLQKECCENETVLLDNDAEFFRSIILPFKVKENYIKLGDKYEKLRRKARDNTPVTALFITSKCNLSCPICYLKYTKYFNELSLDEILSILKESRSNTISITGGEPTTREDLPKIIRLISKGGKVVYLCTNGLRLSDKNYVKELKRNGLNKVYFSFDGFRDDIYEVLRGRKLLRLKLKALKNLKEEKIDTCLISAISKGVNDDQILPLLKFACLNNDFIDEIAFTRLYTGSVVTKNTVFLSELYKKVSMALNIDVQYFIELKRLHFNSYRLAKKLLGKKIESRFKTLLSNIFVFKIEKSKCKPLFSIKELKEINSILEKIIIPEKKIVNVISLLINCFKLKKLMWPFIKYYILRPSNLPIFHLLHKHKKYLKISLCEVSRFGDKLYRGDWLLPEVITLIPS
jgi:molybdenum cofactor biosynthesis enzyme MoaA